MGLGQELLRGARAIALELYEDEQAGDKEQRKHDRRVYHLHQTKQLPTRVEGGQIVTTRTALRKHYGLIA
jgi:hypothetical protein